MNEYADILIRIHSLDEHSGAYPVEAVLEDGSRFLDGELRLDRPKLLAESFDAEAYGLDLFYALFAGSIRRAYDKATSLAQANTDGRVRVRLWIDDDAAELHGIPWERLYHIHRGEAIPLTTSTLTPFSRYTGLEMADPEPVTGRPIRVLFAIANPEGLPPGFAALDVEAEVEIIRQALGGLCRSGQFAVTILPGRSGISPGLGAQLGEVCLNL